MRASDIRPKAKLIRENLRAVKQLYPHVTSSQMLVLRELSNTLGLSVRSGDLLMLDARWYGTHSGLLRVAQRRRCSSMTTELAESVSNPKEARWVFKATVVKSGREQLFVGYGDADPSNVSFLVHGAEMRVAETRAVNRALRKAYGIGICSVEEIGSFAQPSQSCQDPKKLPLQSLPISMPSGNSTARGACWSGKHPPVDTRKNRRDCCLWIRSWFATPGSRALRRSPRSYSSARAWSRCSTCAPPLPMNSARSLAVSWKARSVASSRRTFPCTVESVSPRIRAAAARTWGSALESKR